MNSEHDLRPQSLSGRTPRHRTEQEMRDALRRFCEIAWSGKSVFTIPVDERNDADIILYDAIAELLTLRQQRADAEKELVILRAHSAALEEEKAITLLLDADRDALVEALWTALEMAWEVGRGPYTHYFPVRGEDTPHAEPGFWHTQDNHAPGTPPLPNCMGCRIEPALALTPAAAGERARAVEAAATAAVVAGVYLADTHPQWQLCSCPDCGQIRRLALATGELDVDFTNRALREYKALAGEGSGDV